METLPEEVLFHIASFLPLKEAVRTSVLSTSWRALWKPCIVNGDLDLDQMMQVFGKFLQSYNNPELLRLFYRVPDEKMEEKPYMSAAKGVDRELYLDFSNEELEREAYTLKLDATDENYSKHPCNMASFACLKTLHLKSVSHTVNEFLSALFSNCEFLKCLKLEECHGLQSLDVIARGCLENVIVLDCPDMAEISMASFNLKSFTYKGVFPQIKMKNSPNLIDVTLDMIKGLGQNEFDCEEVLSLLASLKNVETLNITGWLLEFSRLKKFHISEPWMNKSKLDSLACFFDICPSLEKLYIDIDHARKNVTCPYFYQYWHKRYFGLENWILKPNTSSRLERLRIVEVTGFEIQEHDLWLLDFLLKRALLLSSMAVKSLDDIRREVIKLPLSQLKTASRNKEKLMIVLSPNKDYYLGFTEV